MLSTIDMLLDVTKKLQDEFDAVWQFFVTVTNTRSPAVLVVNKANGQSVILVLDVNGEPSQDDLKAAAIQMEHELRQFVTTKAA